MNNTPSIHLLNAMSSCIAALKKYFLLNISARGVADEHFISMINKLDDCINFEQSLNSDNQIEFEPLTDEEIEKSRRERIKTLELIPNEAMVHCAKTLFTYLNAFKEKDGRRLFETIIECGEIPSKTVYSPSRSFSLSKMVEFFSGDKNNSSKVITVSMNVTIDATVND